MPSLAIWFLSGGINPLLKVIGSQHC